MKIVLRHTLHKDLWSVNGGKGPGKSSRRRDDGKELLDDAAKCMRPEEIILRRRFCPAIPSPSWKELEGSLPEKLNLKVSPQNPEWLRLLLGQERGCLLYLISGGWICI